MSHASASLLGMDAGIVFTPSLVVGLSVMGIDGDVPVDDGYDGIQGSVVGWLFVVQCILLASQSWKGCSSCEKGSSHHR